MKVIVILRYLSEQVGSYLTSVLPRPGDRITYYMNNEDRAHPCKDPNPYIGVVSQIEHQIYADQDSPGRIQYLREVYVDLKSWERAFNN